MDLSFKILFYKFCRIRKMGWIESLRNDCSGIGYTFETLIGKKPDHLQRPDYYGIEIKTLKYFGKGKIHLFCSTPDGDSSFSVEKIVKVLGYPDKQFKMFKILCVELNAINYSNIGGKLLKVQVNWESRKIELLAYDIYFNKIDINISWSFDLLKKAIYSKLKKLAIIKANCKDENNKKYFYYRHISFYKFKNLKIFLQLIEKGYIGISFNIGIRKKEENLGKLNDRGTNFFIEEKNIELLFDKIDF